MPAILFPEKREYLWLHFFAFLASFLLGNAVFVLKLALFLHEFSCMASSYFAAISPSEYQYFGG